jgi:pimeloyl-ACP methyl ester carboxylesterase
MPQLHGADDGGILPPQVDDRHRFAAPHALEVVPDVGHFLHIEAPEAIAERIAAWAVAVQPEDRARPATAHPVRARLL